MSPSFRNSPQNFRVSKNLKKSGRLKPTENFRVTKTHNKYGCLKPTTILDVQNTLKILGVQNPLKFSGCPQPTEIYLDVNTPHKYFQVSETHHRLELQLDDVSMSESPESEQAARGGDHHRHYHQHHHHHQHHHCHRHGFHHK